MKSIIRIMFHERKMQYSEKELLDRWKTDHPGMRFIEVDRSLCLGLNDVNIDPDVINGVTIYWYESCSVSLKIHCISTEFTLRKHGGEKGIPFRLQVETYDKNEEKLLHCAACQVCFNAIITFVLFFSQNDDLCLLIFFLKIKVFKPKGADRKNKTDREKIEKKSIDEQQKYRRVMNTTMLNFVPLEIVQSYHVISNKTQIPEFDRNSEVCFQIPTPSPTDVAKFMIEASESINILSTSVEVVDWLNNNRLDKRFFISLLTSL